MNDGGLVSLSSKSQAELYGNAWQLAATMPLWHLRWLCVHHKEVKCMRWYLIDAFWIKGDVSGEGSGGVDNKKLTWVSEQSSKELAWTLKRLTNLHDRYGDPPKPTPPTAALYDPQSFFRLKAGTNRGQCALTRAAPPAVPTATGGALVKTRQKGALQNTFQSLPSLCESDKISEWTWMNRVVRSWLWTLKRLTKPSWPIGTLQNDTP